MELFSQIFLHYIEHMFFRLEIFFAIGIKKSACTRSKKFCSIDNFPEWKTDLQFPYDTIITLKILHRNITLRYRKIPLILPLHISHPPEYMPPKYVTQLTSRI